MKKRTFLIFAAVILLAQEFSITYAKPNCGTTNANCPLTDGSSSSYTYCTTNEGDITPCQGNLTQHKGFCAACSDNGDTCVTGWLYSIYDPNKNLIDPGGCTGYDIPHGCPPTPCPTPTSINSKKFKKGTLG